VNGVVGLAGTAGTAGTPGFQADGIFTSGIVNAGKGNDRLDARDGGFGGGGIFKLGAGKDKAFGFGNVTINAGTGVDTLSLPGDASDYVTESIAGGTSFSRSRTSMSALGFEIIKFLGSADS